MTTVMIVAIVAAVITGISAFVMGGLCAYYKHLKNKK